MRINLDYNKLYYFRYKATLEGQLHVYDKTPLIFIIDFRPTSILGVNLHWIPKKDRIEFFDNVLEIMEKTHKVGRRKERMRLTYELLKKPKFKSGIQAIRMYYLKGMTQIKDVNEAEWNSIIGKLGGRNSKYRMRKVYMHRKYKD